MLVYLQCMLVGGLIWRLAYTTVAPFVTADLVRHLIYGNLTWKQGLGVASQPLEALNPYWCTVSWCKLPYNYPILALFFFSGIGKIYSSLFFVRLILTAIEALNAWFTWRITKSRLLAAIYWLSPISIYWTSLEGQFECVQNAFVLASIYFLQRIPALAWTILVLGIQVKISAVLMLPWFLIETLKITAQSNRWKVFAGVGPAVLIGILPTIVAELHYPSLRQIFTNTVPQNFNPYYFNPFSDFYYNISPGWQWFMNHIVIYGIIVLLMFGSRQKSLWPALIAPCAFLVLIMLHHHIMGWYMLLWLPLVVPLGPGWLRTALFVIHPLMDVYVFRQMFWPHPVKYVTAERLLYKNPFETYP